MSDIIPLLTDSCSRWPCRRGVWLVYKKYVKVTRRCAEPSSLVKVMRVGPRWPNCDAETSKRGAENSNTSWIECVCVNKLGYKTLQHWRKKENKAAKHCSTEESKKTLIQLHDIYCHRHRMPVSNRTVTLGTDGRLPIQMTGDGHGGGMIGKRHIKARATADCGQSIPPTRSRTSAPPSSAESRRFSPPALQGFTLNARCAKNRWGPRLNLCVIF